jgi:hypothetical protein
VQVTENGRRKKRGAEARRSRPDKGYGKKLDGYNYEGKIDLSIIAAAGDSRR